MIRHGWSCDTDGLHTGTFYGAEWCVRQYSLPKGGQHAGAGGSEVRANGGPWTPARGGVYTTMVNVERGDYLDLLGGGDGQ